MIRTPLLCIGGLCICGCLSAQDKVSDAAEKEFAAKARQMAAQERLKVEPVVLAPAKPLVSGQRPTHTNIVTTTFFLEKDAKTAWDPEWGKHFGGQDDPEPSHRRNFIPTAFVPRLNPFYCALPYKWAI